MLIRNKKNWELPESAATPENLYRSRREFLRACGIGAAGVLASSRSLLAATTGFPATANPDFPTGSLKLTPEELVTSYNNFYEFGYDKGEPKELANRGWKTEPWTVELTGLVNKPATLDIADIIKQVGGIEERVYRHRCVEAWSMVIPWDGFQLSKLIALADPKPEARYVRFTSFLDPKSAPGQALENLDYPYVEGLRMDEAMNELAFIATGLYGKAIPNQNGAPLRLVLPWKYGFKGIKSIVKIEFIDSEPLNTWKRMQGSEYGFYANVNPNVDHPRWSQASERIIGSTSIFGGRQPTLMFNGYEEQVAHLYAGMDLRRNY